MSALPSGRQILADPGYLSLKEYVIRATGLAFYGDKDADLASRLAQELHRTRAPNCASYQSLLIDTTTGPSELDALIQHLTIGETFFFRHRELFDALRDVAFPQLRVICGERRQLRIWSAGCSTGAEPYSISILLRRDLAPLFAGWDITILGTDINRGFLAQARDGRFENWAFRTTPPDLRRDCFTPSGKHWEIKPEFRTGVSFQYHNLVAHPFPSLLNNLFAFDLILCRNVTIYFDPPIVQRIIAQFHECLVDKGWLAVGHAEPNLDLFRSFRTVNTAGAVLYQKASPAVSQTPPLLDPLVADGSTAASPVVTAPSLSWETWSPPILPPPIPRVPQPSAPDRARPPSNSQSSDLLASIRTHANQGQWEEAASYCQQALLRDKLNATVHFYQSLICEHLGRHIESEEALRRAIYLDRNHVLAHYYLGLLLQKQGSLPQAVRSFKNVLHLITREPADKKFADADGITAAELSQLTRMHLEILEET